MPYKICFAYLNARGRSLLMPASPIRRCSNNCFKENVHDKYALLEGPTEVRFYVIALHWKNVIGFSDNYCLSTVIIELLLTFEIFHLTFSTFHFTDTTQRCRGHCECWVLPHLYSPGVQGVCQDMQTADDGSGVAPYKKTQKTSIWREHRHCHSCLGDFPELNLSCQLWVHVCVYVPHTQQHPIKWVGWGLS